MIMYNDPPVHATLRRPVQQRMTSDRRTRRLRTLPLAHDLAGAP